MPFVYNPFTGNFDYYQASTATGDVVGPASATDDAIARFDGTTGKLIQNSVAILSDAGALSGLTALSVTGITTQNGGQVWKYTAPGAYPYTVLSSDMVIGVDTSSARTINLPNAPTTGTIYFIKDATGSAATNAISVTTPGGVVLIDDATTNTITGNNYMSRGYLFNGTKYLIL